MSTVVKANFKVTKWDQTAIGDVGSGPEWGRATVLKSFEGGLVGDSRAELLLAGAPEGGAGYIAQERFTGSLAGRSGTFDMQHGGAALPSGETPHQFGYIIPNSGTGELVGLSGTVLYRHDDDGAVLTLTCDWPALPVA